MFCPNCGAELPENAKFCNKCGANLSLKNKNNENVSGGSVPKETVQKQNNTAENNDFVQNHMLNDKLDSMSIMLIASVLLSTVFFPLYFILYIVILVQSKNLVQSTNTFFKKYKAADYIVLTDKVARQIHRQKLTLIGFITISFVSLLTLILEILSDNRDLMVLYFAFWGLVGALAGVLCLYLYFSQNIVFFRFWQVKKAVQSLSTDPHAQLKKPNDIVAFSVISIFVLLMIVSIVFVILSVKQ